jgi:N-(2-amino-2-carboxyethyl)-L-glutamate synthase
MQHNPAVHGSCSAPLGVWPASIDYPLDRGSVGSPQIAESALEIGNGTSFLHLGGSTSAELYLKLEAFNPAGSIKLKPAIAMIEDLEMTRGIRPGRNRIIESSSGNLGVALAFVCRVKGYDFTCVTDPNVNLHTLKLIRAYGGEVIVVDSRDREGGYLAVRIARVMAILATDRSAVWTNQYGNLTNARAHYRWTAPEIEQALPDVDYVFVGAGSTGTAAGCAAYFRQRGRSTKVIAVDTVGSVTFGNPAGARHIPGIGTSRRPELADMLAVDDVVMVFERDAVVGCHKLLHEYGLLTGGSTGSVFMAAERYPMPEGSVAVLVSADLGDRYVDTIYNPDWLVSRGLADPPEALSSEGFEPQDVLSVSART